MRHQKITRLASAAGAAVLAGGAAVAAPKMDAEAVDKAFEALKTYDWGTDRNTLKPIDDAVIATRGDAAARKKLEKGLIDALQSNTSRSAKDFLCRALRTMGTAESVPALAALLPQKDFSHMARYALQGMSCPEAGAAIRDAMPKLSGALKIGMIGSLGVRRDAASVPALVKLLGDADKAVARAAASSLGIIGTPEAGKGLADAAKKANADLKPAVADASLACAEKLLAEGKKADAIALYKQFAGSDQPKHVQLAAKRGMLAAAGKKD